MSVSTDLNTKLIEEMFAVYTEAEQTMLTKVANRVKKGAVDQGWNEVKLKDIQDMKKELKDTMGNAHKMAKGKMGQGILDAYTAGVVSAAKDHGIPQTILKNFVPPHIQRLILESNDLIDNTSFQILRNTMDSYRQVIADTSAQSLTGTVTRQQAAQDALNRFAARGITSFVDKAGRNWELASYAEMAMRTTTARAALQGHIDRQKEIGNDLIVVSGISTTCPICAPWQGKILSISGNDPQYPSLELAKQSGLFHPNCKHTITAWFPDVPDAEPITTTNNPSLYEQTQRQRANERQIRKWKRIESVALTPADKAKANKKVRAWQAEQRRLIDDTGLRRNYSREGIRTRVGDPTKGTTVDGLKPLTKISNSVPYTVNNKTYTSKPVPTTKVPQAEFTYVKDGSFLGGAGEKSIYKDKKGKEYIFKPAVNKNGSGAEFKAYVQEAASSVQKMIDLKNSVDVVAKELDGKLGTMQPLLKVDGKRLDMYNLSEEDIKALQKEHVTDWLLGNFDSHEGNFIYSNGKLLGIDKEQTFKYINDPWSEDISYKYHPNSAYGEKPPVYNKLFKDYKDNMIDMDLQATEKYIKKIEAIPDDVYMESFRSYAESLYGGPGYDADNLLTKIIEKKRTLRKDYEKFYSKLESERTGNTVDFRFKGSPKAPKQKAVKKGAKIDYNKYRRLGSASGRGAYSDVDNIKRDSLHINGLPASEKNAIVRYSGSKYDEMNGWLRNGNSYYDSERKHCDTLIKALNKSPALQEDTLFYRHAGRDTMEHLFSPEIEALSKNAIMYDDKTALSEIQKKITGSTFADKGFLSTSYKEGIFTKNNGIEIQMYTPKGFNNGVFIEEVSSHYTEAEFLINAGQKFKVVEVDIGRIKDSSWSNSTIKNLILKVIPI